MIEQCLPPQSRQLYIRVKAQKHEQAIANHREQLIGLRRESAARGSVLSGQQLLAEWQLSEALIGAMATGFLEAALEACDTYGIPLDKNLSDCIETEIDGFIETKFRQALQNHSYSIGSSALPANIKDVFAGRIRTATFNILNPIRIRLEKTRVVGMRQGANRKNDSKEKNGGVGPDLTSTGHAVVSSEESPAVVTVLNVLISSPSDVSAERTAVESAIQEWNINHHKSTGIMLHPVRWETHAFPALGERPQGILNKQIVRSAHFLIGIFGSRLGTPTGEAPSGTIEEIEEIRKSGRHVSLYFSSAPVPRDVDRAQLDALDEYRLSLQGRGLYFPFASPDELRRLVIQHLPKIVDEVRSIIDSGGRAVVPRKPASVAQQPTRRVLPTDRALVAGLLTSDDLNPKEVELLWNAARSADGEIYHSSTLQGEGIRANDRNFLVEANARTAAEWLSALRGLENRGYIEPLSDARDFFKLTGEGYAAADQSEDFTRWKTQSITLRAYYLNADPQEVKLVCRSVVAVPATYYPDDIGADLSVHRSLKERRSLLVEGLGSVPSIDWQPTDVEFMDDAGGKVETFRVDGMECIRPGTLKLPIISGG